MDEEYKNRVEWFKEARFGMFIHWGLYSIPARGEWVKCYEYLSNEQYQQYFDEFDPDSCDPKQWAKVAKEAGMKYAVLTAKHHDGFCLFDSKYTEYKSINTKSKRDIVREYVDAMRESGIKVGLYYSLLDWYHPDYPHYGDAFHPMRKNEEFKNVHHNFDNYLDYMHAQVKELCESYGKLDLLWFDFSYDDMRGEKWRASELVKMVRLLQPEVIIDNRLEVSGDEFGSLLTDNPKSYSGDFVSPEQVIPPHGIVNDKGEPVTWEACVTMNNHWGYYKGDKNFKSSAVVIRKLVECVSKGGNLLLNIGPDARGNIPEESLNILSDIGKWMNKNSESIYKCTFSELPKPDYGRITQNGNKIYLHVTESVIGALPVKGLNKNDVKKIRLLSSGSELSTTDVWNFSKSYPDYLFLYYGDDPFFTYELPDPTDTVIEIELKS